MKNTNAKMKSNRTAAGRLFNTGFRAAKKDIREGWVTKTEIISDEAGTRKHLEVAIGAGEAFCDGYIAAAK